MRTVDDLVQELNEEEASGNFRVVALAVGFRNTTSFVFGTDADKKEKLHAFILQGGDPVGFVGIRKGNQANTAPTYSRPLQEYADDQNIAKYLTDLSTSIGGTLEAESLKRKVS